MSSGNNYYQFEEAKVAIATELVKRGWKIFGFHEDESDFMTDYWCPASWDGIATKDGFVAVIDCNNNGNSGKEIRQYNYNSEEIVLSEKIRSLIERLSEVRQDRGASASEEETAKRKIKELLAKNEKQEKILIVDRYPEYQPNPPKMSWHVEKDGTIIAKGNGIGKFSRMKYFDKEYSETMFKTSAEGSYDYERAKRDLKMAESFGKLINKIDSAAGCMIGGNGKAYVYTNIETIEYKKENKAVECAGSLKDGQHFIVKKNFSQGICKGYVYRLHENKWDGGEKYYTAYRLDKKLKKELTGMANPANSFGIISGGYKERFLKWIEEGALAWCEIQEVQTPYKVQKCVKRKVETA